MTPQEYLEQERKAEFKSEYLGGEVFAMSRSGEAHNLITGNLLATFHAQLREGPCEVYMTDMRVRVDPAGLYTYPDLSIVCGKPQFEDKERDTLLNPLLIVEVLLSFDHGNKTAMYRKLHSLQEYLLVSQDVVRMERYARQANGDWLLSEADRLEDSMQLVSVPVLLKLSEIYRQVEMTGKP